MANEPKNNNILIIGLFSFLITVVIAGTFIFITFRQADSHRSAESAVSAEEIGPLVPLGSEIIVNIAAEDGSEHYLKVNITLEIRADKQNEEKVKDEVTKRIPQFRDLIISILSTKTKEKIDQKEGKDALRSEIIASINRCLLTGKINNLFFEDFVIQ
jgi:flagellar FliL protein